jgi:transposase
MKTYTRCFVGVDTHKFTHTAAIIDQTFKLIGFVETKALPSCYPTFFKRIREKAGTRQLMFGLEDIAGFGMSLYRFLYDAQQDIREINPVKTWDERRRKTHPDKSDPDDALDIAKVLAQEWRTLPRFHRDDTIVALHHLTRQREELVSQLVAAKNRLHAALHQTYPGYRNFFSDTFHKGALRFWSRFPTSTHLKHFGPQRLLNFIEQDVTPRKAHLATKTILAHVQTKNTSLAIAAAYENIIPPIVSTIETVQQQIKSLEPYIEEQVLKTPYQLHTMQGLGISSAAEIIAQVSPVERFSSASKLARFIGIAPRKWGTAKRLKYRKSLRGRRSLHKTFYLVALSQIVVNRNGKPRCPKARNYYLRKVKEGKSHSAALKCLQRRLVDVVYAMMKNKTEFNPKMSKSKK